MMKNFKIRVNEATKEIGIKEDYRCIRDGDTYSLYAIFCLDRLLTPTKPALFSKNGYVPVSDCVDISDIEATEAYLSQKRGIYSILQTTLLICVVKGRIRNNEWVDGVACDFYLPYEANSDNTELTGIKVAEGKVIGCLELENIGVLRKDVLNLVLDTHPYKAKLVYKRFLEPIRTVGHTVETMQQELEKELDDIPSSSDEVTNEFEMRQGQEEVAEVSVSDEDEIVENGSNKAVKEINKDVVESLDESSYQHEEL